MTVMRLIQIVSRASNLDFW